MVKLQSEFHFPKPDFADRAITEALVNALIHRDYIILDSEIHINIYDNRLKIQSPGGMYNGKIIQECELYSRRKKKRYRP